MSIFIGIDPGVETGLAVWDADAGRFAEITTTSIIGAMKIVLDYSASREVVLVAEDARQRKWIPREKSLSQFRGRAMGAGSVKRDSQIWEEFARFNVLRLILVAPKDNRTKMKAEPFRRLTGWQGRTNEHGRDAAMLVFGRKSNPSTL